ncbi:MAG: sulfatase-like hydrolase/transferase [Deltaproteobacteria bacterium]|nr:sulfatase-like hydrolase/transferase [Deltaproteobacteria bacterium]
MKKSSKLIFIIILSIALLVSVSFLTILSVQKYKSNNESVPYEKREAKKQEFVYHSLSPLKKAFVPSSPDNPNIILISLDTLRAQSMSCYGFKKKTTPFIDQIAKEGVLFANMCAAATSTPPSHMSMMTGLYLSVHGVLNKQVLDQKIKTLPEILSDIGYATCAVTEDGFLVRDMGFGRVFDAYYEIKDVVLFDKLSVVGGFAKDVFKRGKNWIDEKIDQKFFLFLHTYEVHGPLFPPPPYDTMFLKSPDNYSKYFKLFREYKGRVDMHSIPPEFLRAQYEGEIRYVDEVIKDFMAFLNNRGLGRKTLVIITSDHGEELFERQNIVGHGYHTYDTESHIPFIMWMPGKIPPGIRIKNQVSNVDILPTVVDFLQLNLMEQVQGQSLYPLIQGPNSYDERLVFCETAKQNCVRSLQYKFIDSNELYLYNSDPEEQYNQAKVQKKLCATAADALSAFKEQCQSLKTKKGLHAKEKSIAFSDDTINKMKALGYIQ